MTTPQAAPSTQSPRSRVPPIARGLPRSLRGVQLFPLHLVLIGALALAASSALVWRAGEWGRRAALTELHGVAAASLGLHAAALRSDLEKHRAVAFVLARDSDIAALLLGHPSDPGVVDRANRKLEALGEGIRAAAETSVPPPC